MRKTVLIICFSSLAFLISACSAFFFLRAPHYVKVDGTQFVLDGKPYYFTGTNLWYGCYIGSSGTTGDRARLIRELDRLKSLGITNLRILGASEESYITNSLKPAIQTEPGVYDQDLLGGLDYLLSEMYERDMHAVIFLNNYWEWSGGMAQYNDWANGGGGVDPAHGNYPAFMDYSATFYRNPKAQTLFYNYVLSLLTRWNKYSCYYYYNDPTIMAWELANEPRPGRNASLLREYYEWIDSTARYIHSIDSKHLVTTSNEGLMGSLGDSTIYLTAQAFKSIDYATFHLWPKNWGWFDAKKIAETYPSTEKKAVEYVNEHIAFARQLGKPTVMEEFGMPRDSEYCKAGTPTTARNRYFKKILTLIYDSAAAGGPISGTNFWGWGGEGRGRHPDDRWRPGDPFTGDPPQEPQGLNSVYDSDSTTITILIENASKMFQLRYKEDLSLEKKIARISR